MKLMKVYTSAPFLCYAINMLDENLFKIIFHLFDIIADFGS